MTLLNLVEAPLRTKRYVMDRPVAEILLPGSPDTYRRMAELLSDRETLLREVNHRVGNSLQIIASIVAQDARKVQSVEARLHLENAHRRILAVASVQQQLQVSTDGGDLELGTYLRQLCENLSASVVGDAARIVIEVRADPGKVSSSIATSMGLIVTELAINALKHAFMANAAGRIRVIYRVYQGGWKLCVSDNGVGKPGLGPAGTGVGKPGLGPAGTGIGKPGLGPAGTGLGGGIVDALVRQLGGSIEVSAGLVAGTSVMITSRLAGPTY